MLSLAAAGLERLHDLKWKALGMDRDSVLPDELPELIIRDLTTKEIEELQAAQEGEDADSGILPDDSETHDPEADEIVFETGEADPKPPKSKPAPRTDAEGCRLVREAQA
jgi:hypothetical protein